MAKGKWNETAQIRGALRRVFSRSPVIREVMWKGRREVAKYNKDGSRSKKDTVQYLCNVCNTYVGSTHVSVDHIVPVISVDEGFQDWNEFVARLFCGANNLQIICDFDHNLKTQKERIARLVKSYTEQLDFIEKSINDSSVPESLNLKVFLKKFVSKKKTSGLEGIATRAQQILNKLPKS